MACGRYPAKAVVRQRVTVSATVFREGPGAFGANVCWRPPGAADDDKLIPMRRDADRSTCYDATAVPGRLGRLRPRDFDGALAQGRSLQPLITTRSDIRRWHAALQRMKGLTFHEVSNDNLLCYSRRDETGGDVVIVVCCVLTRGPSSGVRPTCRCPHSVWGGPMWLPSSTNSPVRPTSGGNVTPSGWTRTGVRRTS